MAPNIVCERLKYDRVYLRPSSEPLRLASRESMRIWRSCFTGGSVSVARRLASSARTARVAASERSSNPGLRSKISSSSPLMPRLAAASGLWRASNSRTTWVFWSLFATQAGGALGGVFWAVAGPPANTKRTIADAAQRFRRQLETTWLIDSLLTGKWSRVTRRDSQERGLLGNPRRLHQFFTLASACFHRPPESWSDNGRRRTYRGDVYAATVLTCGRHSCFGIPPVFRRAAGSPAAGSRGRARREPGGGGAARRRAAGVDPAEGGGRHLPAHHQRGRRGGRQAGLRGIFQRCRARDAARHPVGEQDGDQPADRAGHRPRCDPRRRREGLRFLPRAAERRQEPRPAQAPGDDRGPAHHELAVRMRRQQRVFIRQRGADVCHGGLARLLPRPADQGFCALGHQAEGFALWPQLLLLHGRRLHPRR